MYQVDRIKAADMDASSMITNDTMVIWVRITRPTIYVPSSCEDCVGVVNIPTKKNIATAQGIAGITKSALFIYSTKRIVLMYRRMYFKMGPSFI